MLIPQMDMEFNYSGFPQIYEKFSLSSFCNVSLENVALQVISPCWTLNQHGDLSYLQWNSILFKLLLVYKGYDKTVQVPFSS